MKLLLDENFPRRLLRHLRAEGFEADHIVDLGQRGVSDTVIRRRLITEDLVFLTQDTEFGDWPPAHRGTVILSRVPQSLPIQERVEIWMRAMRDFKARDQEGNLFEILETGELVRWESRELN